MPGVWDLKNLKIENLFPRIIFAAIFIPICIFAVIGFSRMYTDLTEFALSRKMAAAHLAAETLKERFDRLKDVGISLATRKRFAQLVTEGSWQEAIAILEHVPQDFPYINRLFLSDPAGNLMTDIPALPEVRGKNFSHRDWYKGVSRNWQPYVSEIYNRAAPPQEPVIATAIPIKSDDGRVTGILVLQIHMSTLLHWAEEFEEKDVGGIYFVDTKGQTIEFFAGKSEDQKIKSLSGMSIVERVLAGEQGVHAQSIYPDSKEPMVSAFAPVPDYGWGAIVRQPVAQVFAIRNSAIISLTTLFALILLFSCILSYIIFKAIALQRKAEEARLEAEERLDLALRASGIGTWEWEPEQGVFRWGHGSQTLLGLPAGLPTSKFDEFLCCIHPQDRERIARELKSLKQHGMEYASEFRALWPDGSVRVLEIRGKACSDRHPLRAEGVCWDITRRIEDKNELEAARLVAEKANRTKSEFLAVMSHELRTPLNAIIGFSEVLKAETFGPLNAKQKDYIHDVWDSGKHLLSLINDILDLSKIEAGKMELEISNVDLPTIIRNSFLIIKERCLVSDVRISHEIEETIGTIRADERKVKQILFNLLSNASKFVNEGGHIGIEAKIYSKNEVMISVWDTGIGIEEKDREKIFKEFVQIDNPIFRKGLGTGLGLALVKKMVELHGGRVWFESGGRDRGTRFSFTLPMDRGSILKHAAEQKHLVPSEFVGSVDPKTAGRPVVLVIEDDLKTVKLLTMYLEEAGYAVVAAFSGEEGLVKAREFKPALITLDLILPHKDGWDVLSELKMDPETRGIPMVIISILDNSGRGLTFGVTEYITKPVNKEMLYETLSRLGFSAPTNLGRPAKIVAIDDDPTSVEIIQAFLSPLGFRVFKAYGGREGLEVIRREKPDLILLDLLMPEVSGFDVLRELKKDPATDHIAVVILTVKNLSESDKKFLRDHAEAIILKAGFDKEVFLKEVSRALRLKMEAKEE